jgi:hypothetical protein
MRLSSEITVELATMSSAALRWILRQHVGADAAAGGQWVSNRRQISFRKGTFFGIPKLLLAENPQTAAGRKRCHVHSEGVRISHVLGD